jgi:SAM-dependent methyltransferase
MTKSVADKTIEDFGRQHHAYADRPGYYISTEILGDVLGPLMDIKEFEGLDILDLGSGSGRWVRILHQLGVKSIAAVEPSAAIEVCKANTKDLEGVSYHNIRGDEMPDGRYDLIFSYGVVHHIPEPAPVMARACEVLRPGGKVVIWLYGRENNGLYLAFMNCLRVMTVPMSDRGLDRVSAALVPLVRLYGRLSKFLPLPLRGYFASYVDRIDNHTLQHVIYDQLNPHYAKYYRRGDVIALLEDAGFVDIRLYHRQAYSWTAVATKPEAD